MVVLFFDTIDTILSLRGVSGRYPGQPPVLDLLNHSSGQQYFAFGSGEGTLRKNAKHALILVADSPGFSVFLLFYRLATILLFGADGLSLAWTGRHSLGSRGGKLKLKKYD